MTAHIPRALAEEVDQLAQRLDRSKGWVVKQALAAYVVRETEHHRMTLEAMGEVQAQRGAAHEDVKAWAASLGTEHPLCRPE